MQRTRPPLLGYNNNVKHRGQVFHIQTEDSGIKHARIVTHLFADGGRIVHTKRTNYREQLAEQNLTDLVRALMKEQHRAMFLALRGGEFDQAIFGDSEDAGRRSVTDTEDVLVSVLPPPPALPSVEPARPAVPTVRDSGTFRQARPVAPEQAAADLEAAAEAIAARARRQRTLSNPSLRKVSPSMPPPPESAFDLDIDSLGQTSAPSRARASRKRRSERPARKSSRPRQPAPVRDETSPSPRARPAAAFGQAPAAHSRSIFGDNVSSEKSLDEVILSYLADDIEESSGGSK